MAPTLYVIYSSPPVRAVLITAKAIGLELDLKEVDWKKGEQLTPEYLKKNPQHTMPCLEEDDGFTCWDSHAIMAYSITKYAKDDSLYPKDPRKRVIVDQRLHFDCGVLFARMLGVEQPYLFKGTQTLEDQSKVDGIYQAYEFLNTFLEGNKWVAGNTKTIADYSLFASMSSIRTIIPVDEKKYPNIIAWLKQVEVLPEAKVNVKGLEEFKQLFAGLRLP